jgi:hypothetical protein
MVQRNTPPPPIPAKGETLPKKVLKFKEASLQIVPHYVIEQFGIYLLIHF